MPVGVNHPLAPGGHFTTLCVCVCVCGWVRVLSTPAGGASGERMINSGSLYPRVSLSRSYAAPKSLSFRLEDCTPRRLYS